MSKRQRYTPEQKAEALDLLAAHGVAEASRRTGIPGGTIGSWGNRNGIVAPSPELTQQATASRLATVAQRKTAIAEQLIEDVVWLQKILRGPALERRVVVVKGGHADQGTVPEIVDVKHTHHGAADLKRIVEAIAVGVETVQLLTGGLTANLGVTPVEPEAAPLEASERRERALATVHQLGTRAAS